MTYDTRKPADAEAPLPPGARPATADSFPPRSRPSCMCAGAATRREMPGRRHGSRAGHATAADAPTCMPPSQTACWLERKSLRPARGLNPSRPPPLVRGVPPRGRGSSIDATKNGSANRYGQATSAEHYALGRGAALAPTTPRRPRGLRLRGHGTAAPPRPDPRLAPRFGQPARLPPEAVQPFPRLGDPRCLPHRAAGPEPGSRGTARVLPDRTGCATRTTRGAPNRRDMSSMARIGSSRGHPGDVPTVQVCVGAPIVMW